MGAGRRLVKKRGSNRLRESERASDPRRSELEAPQTSRGPGAFVLGGGR